MHSPLEVTVDLFVFVFVVIVEPVRVTLFVSHLRFSEVGFQWSAKVRQLLSVLLALAQKVMAIVSALLYNGSLPSTAQASFEI